MKTLPRIGLLLVGILLGSGARLGAQTFDLGSNGSYGAINLTSSQSVTLQVPPDGVFHCTTITLANSAELRFAKNAANTPVYLLATGDVSLGSSATIYVNGTSASGIAAGIGGPGGFDGGQGGESPGDGQGPGGGKIGWADTSTSYGTKPANVEYRGSAGYAYRPTGSAQALTAGNSYGNALLMPLIGGSGGGGGKASTLQYAYGGGGGGGALLIASNTRIVFTSNSTLNATGGSGSSGQHGNGSGGSVRLVAPTIQGTFRLYVWPGTSQNSATYGSYGRTRIDSLNIANLTITDEGGASPKSRDFVTYGANMTVFPPNFPGLRITQVGTQVIPGTQVAPVFVLFPAGSPATQTVTVSCTNFNSTVPLRAVVTPQSGSTQTFDFTVDNTAGGTTSGSVQVQIPAGVASRVDVWTR